MTDIHDHPERFSIHGIDIVADIRGEGPAILFVHGYPLSRAMWRHQAAGLDGWRTIAPDLRGMGESAAPPAGYSMETYADDLRALLDAHDVEDVVLCGLSMGGYVVFECLRRWRARVRGVVLMDTRAEADDPETQRGRIAAAAEARDAGAEGIAGDMVPKMLAPSTLHTAPATVTWLRALIAATPVDGIVGALDAMRTRPDSTSLLGTIDVPALVVVGEEDAITPPDRVGAMAAAIRGADLVVIPGAGHLPPIEQAEVTTNALREFLAPLR